MEFTFELKSTGAILGTYKANNEVDAYNFFLDDIGDFDYVSDVPDHIKVYTSFWKECFYCRKHVLQHDVRNWNSKDWQREAGFHHIECEWIHKRGCIE